MAIRALYGGDAGGDGRSGAGNSAGRDGLCAGRRCPDAESRRDIVIALAGAVAGAIIGSFLATLILRWPQGRSVVHGRSACDGCGLALGVLELVPLFSALAQSGACRACGAAIDPLHWRREAGGGLLGAVGLERGRAAGWE